MVLEIAMPNRQLCLSVEVVLGAQELFFDMHSTKGKKDSSKCSNKFSKNMNLKNLLKFLQVLANIILTPFISEGNSMFKERLLQLINLSILYVGKMQNCFRNSNSTYMHLPIAYSHALGFLSA